MGRQRRSGRGTSPIGPGPPPARPSLTFEAYIPESGNWVSTDRERSKVTLYCSHEAGAALTAATPGLVDRVLVAAITAQ